MRPIRDTPDTATTKSVARLNSVVTIEDIQAMYGMSKSQTWMRVKLYCVYIQRKPRGTILVDLGSVLKVFGTPLTALPIAKVREHSERTNQ